eukprot:13575462-Alexandrium_andersonii.AAC.1
MHGGRLSTPPPQVQFLKSESRLCWSHDFERPGCLPDIELAPVRRVLRAAARLLPRAPRPWDK